uniref:Uncharacterized protein n=1 Tax=Anguilla anguilla TaxID=7936 RepID=A0A0E9SNL0_ANGAN
MLQFYKKYPYTTYYNTLQYFFFPALLT